MLYISKNTTSNGKYNRTGEQTVGEELEGRFRGLTHVLSGLAENSLKTAGFPSAL
jgi:hypothetical protein